MLFIVKRYPFRYYFKYPSFILAKNHEEAINKFLTEKRFQCLKPIKYKPYPELHPNYEKIEVNHIYKRQIMGRWTVTIEKWYQFIKNKKKERNEIINEQNRRVFGSVTDRK